MFEVSEVLEVSVDAVAPHDDSSLATVALVVSFVPEPVVPDVPDVLVAAVVAVVPEVAEVAEAAVSATACCTAKAPVMTRNELTLAAAAAVRARRAGWGRFRRRAEGAGAGGVGVGLASMDTTVRPEPGSFRRASGDSTGSGPIPVRGRQTFDERALCSLRGPYEWVSEGPGT